MQNFENLDVFEILITQRLLKCLKDPFVRSALIIFENIRVSNDLGAGLAWRFVVPDLGSNYFEKAISRRRMASLVMK